MGFFDCGANTDNETITAPRSVQPHFDALHDRPPALSENTLQEVQGLFLTQRHDWTLIDGVAHNPGTLRIWQFQRKAQMRADLSVCRPPSCGVCSDDQHCFGPEETTPLGIIPT